jgi:GntR family transcriptional regulator
MILNVSPGGDLPIYRQIMRQILDAIAGGRLAPGAQLPSHRDLSEQLVIAPLTVKKAYDELEKLGYVESARGRGTFVTAALPELANAERSARVREAARTLLRQAYLAGLSWAEVLTLLAETDRVLTGRASSPAASDSPRASAGHRPALP